MCGIVLVKNNNGRKACRTVFKRYEQQSKRGTQGYGAVTVSNGIVQKVYRSRDVNGIRDIYQDPAETILFHHRTPTSTPNYIECTHPIFVSNDKLDSDYLVVHNGVISNSHVLRLEFEKMGFIYNTVIQEMYVAKASGEQYVTDVEKFNDSESFAIDLALAIEGNLDSLKSRGSIAFVALQVNKETNKVVQIFFGRNNANPLKMDTRNDSFILASEGYGEDVKPHKLYSYDMGNGEIDCTDLDVGINYTPPADTTHNRTYPEGYFSNRGGDVSETRVYRGGTESHRGYHDVQPKLPMLGAPSTTTQKKVEKSSFEDRLQKSSITIYKKDTEEVEVVIEVPVLDNRLYRTNIDIMDFGIITKDEWFKFIKVDSDIDSYLGIYKDGHKFGLVLDDEDKETCTRLLSNNFKWLKEFSKNVHHRALLENKF